MEPEDIIQPQPTEADIAEARIREQADCREFHHYGTRAGARYMTSFGVESESLGKRVVNRSRLALVPGTDDYSCAGYDRTVESY